MASIGVLMLKREQKSRRMRRRQQTRTSAVTPPTAPKNDWSNRVIHRCMAARIFMEADQVHVAFK